MSDDGYGPDRHNENSDGVGAQLEVDGGTITVDEVLECLVDSRRRVILYYLQDNPVADLDELSTHILAREDEIQPTNIPPDRQQQVQAQLVHRHLPKLASARLIEFDQRSRTVRYRHPPQLLDTILRFLARLEREE